MSDATFDPDDSFFEVADVISIVAPQPPPAALPGDAEAALRGDVVPLQRYQTAANEVLATNEPIRDRLESALGKAKGEETGSFENLVAETKHQAKAEDILDQAVLDASSLNAAHSELGLALALGATSVVALGQWWIDHNILLSSFPMLSRLSVSCLALVAVSGSMVSAHVAGAAAKDIDFEPAQDPAAKTNRRNKTLGSVFGVGIEVMLAVVRAAQTGAVLTSLLLGAAGLALWVFARSIAYRHRSKDLIQLYRATKAERAARGRATGCRRRQVDVTARHALTHRKLVERAHGVVDRLVAEGHAAEVAWARVNPTVPFPGVTPPGAADVWRRYTQGWLPAELELPTRELPSLDDFRANTPTTADAPERLALGRGGAR